MIRALYKHGLKFSPEASLPHPPSRILSQVFSFLPVHFADCRCDRFFFHLLLFFFFFLVNPFSQGRKRRANSPPPRLPSSLLLFSCLIRRQTKRVIIFRITVPATFHLKQSFRVETPKLCYILYLLYSMCLSKVLCASMVAGVGSPSLTSTDSESGEGGSPPSPPPVLF